MVWTGRVSPLWSWGPLEAVVDEYRPPAAALIGHRPPASPEHGQNGRPIISVAVSTQVPPMQPKGELEIANARPWGGCRAGHVSVPRYQTPRSGLKFPPWTGPLHTTHHTPHTHTWGSCATDTARPAGAPNNPTPLTAIPSPWPLHLDQIPTSTARCPGAACGPESPSRLSLFADASGIIRLSQSRPSPAPPPASVAIPFSRPPMPVQDRGGPN